MIGILLMTNEKIGNALLSAAKSTFNTLPLPAIALEVCNDCDKDALLLQAQQVIKQLDSGDGVLILTDLFGSTASNLAFSLLENEKHDVQVISGVNLPMLIRTFNYPDLNLQQAAQKATTGGQDGIVNKIPVYE